MSGASISETMIKRDFASVAKQIYNFRVTIQVGRTFTLAMTVGSAKIAVLGSAKCVPPQG